MPKDSIELDDLAEAFGEIKTGFETFKTKNDEHLNEVKKGFDDVVRKEELSKIQESISQAETKYDQILARVRSMSVNDNDNSNESKMFEDWARLNLKRQDRQLTEDYGTKEAEAYRSAFNSYLRKKDEKLLDADEMKALSVGRDPDGGIVVLPDTSGRIIKRIYETSPVRQYANIETIGTDALEGLYDLDEAGVGWVGETQARTETSTPQLEKYRIPVHEMYANPRATQKLIDDASIDMEAWLQGKVAEKMGRFEATAFVNGDGIGKPRGFLTYDPWASEGVFELKKVEQYETGVDGAFAADPNGGDVLLDVIYGLLPQYRANANWFMNRLTTKAVRKLKDTDGAYLWQPGLQAGQPASLLGYSVASFEDMPDIANNSLSMAFGDMREHYTVVDRQGIRLLIDPYTQKPYVQYYTTRRVGGDVTNFEAMKLVKFT